MQVQRQCSLRGVPESRSNRAPLFIAAPSAAFRNLNEISIASSRHWIAPGPFCNSPLRPAADASAARLTLVPRSTAAASYSNSSDDSNKPAASLDIPDGKSSLLDKIRALAFFLWSLTLAVPLFIIMAVMSPLVLALDKYKRLAQHFVNNVWAKISTSLFYRVEIQGRENLPPPDKPVVYVANHQSFLDIYSLFHLDRPFKFISKTSIFMIPIVGWSMFLTGHVGLKRTDRKSQLECLKQCRDLLGKGAPVLFFPEGTRSPDCVMAGFKKGAFSVAVKAGVDVVPITLLGTGVMMPSGSEGLLKGGRVKIVVHPPIKTTGRDADEVCSESREIIAKSMPKALIGSATKMAADES